MLSLLVVLFTGNQAMNRGLPKVNPQLTQLLVYAATDDFSTRQAATHAGKNARANQVAFDRFVDSFAERSENSKVLMEGELVKIARDRAEHPEHYATIEQRYMFVNATPSFRSPHPPQPDPAHLTPDYRYAWEFYFIRPKTGKEVTGFTRLCSMSMTRIMGKASANEVYRAFALTVASTAQRGVGIDRLVLWSFNQLIGDTTNIESIHALLEIGAMWNVHHLGATMEYVSTYEMHIANELSSAAVGRAPDELRSTWAGVGGVGLTDDERKVVQNVNAIVAKQARTKI